MQHSDQGPQTWTRATLLEYLATRGMVIEESLHAPVFNMGESAALALKLPGSRCKNLLVRDKKGAHRFLVVTGPEVSTDLGALGRVLGVGRLSLCPPEDLLQCLQVTPGSLSPLALVADPAPAKVRLILDERLRGQAHFLFHPLVNTATLSMGQADFLAFVKTTGHAVEYVDIPVRAPAENALG